MAPSRGYVSSYVPVVECTSREYRCPGVFCRKRGEREGGRWSWKELVAEAQWAVGRLSESWRWTWTGDGMFELPMLRHNHVMKSKSKYFPLTFPSNKNLNNTY